MRHFPALSQKLLVGGQRCYAETGFAQQKMILRTGD